jgi:hypothetical protein
MSESSMRAVQVVKAGGALSDCPFRLRVSTFYPFILSHDAMLYAVLRTTHSILAYFFFLTFIAHFGPILFHTLIVRRRNLEADGAVEHSAVGDIVHLHCAVSGIIIWHGMIRREWFRRS